MNFNDIYEDYLLTVEQLGSTPSESLLLASITEQSLMRYHKGKSVKRYHMSSSKRPPSCVEDSLGTPIGLHLVCEKIGDGEPLGMIFKGRKPQGVRFFECDNGENQKNLITTRILRLDGLEVGINKGEGIDTYERYVYIHGTNHEEKLGTPTSSGCLQVSNKDILELFECLPEGTHLFIEKVLM